MAAKPEPFPSLQGGIRQDRATAQRSRNASPFFGTGIHPTGDGGMESDAFDGDLATADAGTTGWAFNDQKVALGEVILRLGSIGNDSLANPIQVSSTVGSAVNFAITTTPTKRATSPLTVPAGFSQALVFCFVNGDAFNDTASADFLTVQAAVNGATGGGVIATIGAGSYGTTVTAVRTSTLSGLNGGDTVTAEAWIASSNAGWAASTSNFVFINAFALWLR